MGRFGGRIMVGYRQLLDFTLSARLLVVGGTAIVALSAVAIFQNLHEELLPAEDRGISIGAARQQAAWAAKGGFDVTFEL